MAEVILNERGKEVLINELQKYYKNFGSMNKNDFEVLLFHVLIENSDDEMSNFELSRMLRIPEPKVKRLRYEVDLKYSSDERYREEKLQQLNKLLTKVSYKNQDKFIEFVVEDIALRRFLDNILKTKNRFSDSSFNSEIVKIDIKDLEILLRESVENDRLCEQLRKDAEKLLAKRIEFAELLPDLVKCAVNTTSFIADVSLPGLFKALPNILKFISVKNKNK